MNPIAIKRDLSRKVLAVLLATDEELSKEKQELCIKKRGRLRKTSSASFSIQ
jgi:hypothetical protein